MSKKTMACKLVELPTKEIIDNCIKKFDGEQRRNEDAVNFAFLSTNCSFESVLVNVIVLNSRYSTRLSDNDPSVQTINNALSKNRSIMPSVIKVAQKIDSFELEGRFDACKDISDVAKLIKDFQSFSKPYRQPYSFITKYCSFRLPDIDIPIVDNFVRALLIVFNEKDSFYERKLNNNLLGDYDEFLKVIKAFSEKYAKGYTAKEIDKYLWQYSKDLFNDGFDIRNIL